MQYVLSLLGAGAVQGSIKWWCRGHRAHHRYTDTDLDPYNAHKGLLWSHVGWMLVKPRRKPGVADISDLTRDPVVRWQHRNYLLLILVMAFVVPTLIPWLWGDARGGYVYAGVLRLVFVHHVSYIRVAVVVEYLFTFLIVDILRQLSSALLGRITFRRQAHSSRSSDHCTSDGWRRLP